MIVRVVLSPKKAPSRRIRNGNPHDTRVYDFDSRRRPSPPANHRAGTALWSDKEDIAEGSTPPSKRRLLLVLRKQESTCATPFAFGPRERCPGIEEGEAGPNLANDGGKIVSILLKEEAGPSSFQRERTEGRPPSGRRRKGEACPIRFQERGKKDWAAGRSISKGDGHREGWKKSGGTMLGSTKKIRALTLTEEKKRCGVLQKSQKTSLKKKKPVRLFQPTREEAGRGGFFLIYKKRGRIDSASPALHEGRFHQIRSIPGTKENTGIAAEKENSKRFVEGRESVTFGLPKKGPSKCAVSGSAFGKIDERQRSSI